jgi:tRNA-2-methylthio-N6-dimethylallyladenosine synthase
MEKKHLYLNTIGCQMNVYDSETIAGLLKTLDYERTDDIDRADLIIVNTCAIREKAEQKVFSFLGRLAGLKNRKKTLIIAVGGCVAQQEGKAILDRVPFVDLVFGTHAIGRLPDLVGRIESRKERLVAVEISEIIDEFDLPVATGDQPSVSRFVTIMRGCDNYCTYCVVPYVRGREVSRNPEDILKEIRRLVAAGVREVTLLGQNVNSYGLKQDLCSFPELLSMVNEIQGLHRIRFTTSHPKDLSGDLVDAFRNLGKLCNHIHLPVQSGSNRILKKMNRRYTREAYLEKVARLRRVRPDIAITSDFITGFPGETEDDFDLTLDLINRVGYDGLFAFHYSDRPNAPGSGFPDKVSETVKRERLRRLLDLQEKYTLAKNRNLVGSQQVVLVEGFSKKQGSGCRQEGSKDVQWSGRTSSNKIVNFSIQGQTGMQKPISAGSLVTVRIEKALAHSLVGSLLLT